MSGLTRSVIGGMKGEGGGGVVIAHEQAHQVGDHNGMGVGGEGVWSLRHQVSG